MAYNRWLYSDELYHHGVKGQSWGKRNGPPYPLSRQEKFRTYAPDGHPITSKKAYKKAMSVERANRKEERSKHLNGTPEDHKERNGFVATIKRGYRQYKNEQKAEREREEQEKRNWIAAKERLKKSNIPEDIQKRMIRESLGYDPDDKTPGQHWGVGSGRYPHGSAQADYDGKSTYRSGVAEKLWDNDTFSGDDTESQRLNKIIDAYEAKQKSNREAAKEHGTAEEVMKFRESFTKEEWTEIANRLEAEARVRKLLDKPFEPAQNQGQGQKQNNISNQPVSKSEEPQQFKDSLAKKLYKEGTAREVYNYRKGFTPEQLNSVTDRLKAEETVGQYAKNQINLKSNQQIALEKLRDYIGIAGDTFDSLGKIKKFFSGGGGGNSKPNRNK